MVEKKRQTGDAIPKTDSEFKDLEKEHHRLEVALNELVGHKTLTPGEQVEKKRIQLEKLRIKYRIEAIQRSSDGSRQNPRRAEGA